VEESVENSLGEQADADSAHLLELIRDYLALISSVKVSPELESSEQSDLTPPTCWSSSGTTWLSSPQSR
jgi:hypothetical protein